MAIFYTRQEDEKSITIILKYRIVFFISLLGMIVFATPGLPINNDMGQIIAGAFALLSIYYLIELQKVRKELKKYMENGEVRVSGSSYSLSNPPTYKIDK